MAIIYRTTDGAKWGSGKGANLTAGEVDNNFWDLAERTLALESNPPQAAEISNIEVIGSQMMIYLSNGDSYGPYTLPVAMFRFRGEWSPTTNYAFMDLVTVRQLGLYFVNQTHTSDDTFDPARQESGENVYTLMFGESSYVYNFGFFYPMRPGQGITSGGYMAARLFEYPVGLAAGLPGSLAKLRVAPAADLTFDICDKDDNVLGDITFAATETEGVFTFDNDWTGDVGDILYLAPPVSLDDDARDLMVTIVGTRIL